MEQGKKQRHRPHRFEVCLIIDWVYTNSLYIGYSFKGWEETWEIIR